MKKRKQNARRIERILAKSKVYSHDFMMNPPVDAFYIAETSITNAGKVLGISKRKNPYYQTAEEMRRKLKVKKAVLLKLERLMKRRKIKNGYLFPKG